MPVSRLGLRRRRAVRAHPGAARRAPAAQGARQDLPRVERYGLVWVSLGEPARDVPPFPEWEDGGFRKLLCGPYAVEASGPRIVENFLDVAHFPFVHENVLGTPERPEIADYEAVITDQGVEATGVRVYQPDPYGTGQGDWVSYTYRACARSRPTCSRNRPARGSRSCSRSRRTSRRGARPGCGWP